MESKTKTKICPRCKKELPLTSFNNNRARPDGLSFYCRGCAYSLQTESRTRQRLLRLLNSCFGDLPVGLNESRDSFLQLVEDAGVHQCPKCHRWLSRSRFYHAGNHRANVCIRCTVLAPKSSESDDKPPRSTRLTGESFMDQFRDYCGGLLPEHCLPPTEEEGA